jgi:DNA topoisomerase I
LHVAVVRQLFEKTTRMKSNNGPQAPANTQNAESLHLRGTAAATHLRYVTDAVPGIRRSRAGRGFCYIDSTGSKVRDVQVLKRIKALAIPPAWTQVWICSYENGHIQAIGRDQRKRKQYRYHTQWREMRDESKFDQMLAFGQMLPAIRKQVERDLSRSGLPCEKILAVLVRLLESTLIRIGNEEYVRANKSFGLTTLRDRHVQITGPMIRFQFRGKSGVEHSVDVKDRKVARILRNAADLPGEVLFQYLDDSGERRSIESTDVNQYLRQITGQEFSAKDFRTWAGTVLSVQALLTFPELTSIAQAKRDVSQAVAAVAKVLGNTRSVCRKCYIHPQVVMAFMEGSLTKSVKKISDRRKPGFRPEEWKTLVFLKNRIAGGGRSASRAAKNIGSVSSRFDAHNPLLA